MSNRSQDALTHTERNFNDVKRGFAARYIADNFEPRDRLALVLLNKRTGAAVQRIAPVEKLASEEMQRWLRHMNAQKFEVYVSMNALRADAHGRTKGDIGEIRHVYLDLDHKGEEALKAVADRDDLPAPNYIVNTSPGKYQVVWRVEGFSLEDAEALQRQLAAEVGADPAATDSSRVMRLPGFFNHKYELPHYVTADKISRETHDRIRFPEVAPSKMPGELNTPPSTSARRPQSGGGLSQSERDWAYAKSELWRGRSPESVIQIITERRQDDKPKPRDYAERTVRKAMQVLEAEGRRADRGSTGPER